MSEGPFPEGKWHSGNVADMCISGTYPEYRDHIEKGLKSMINHKLGIMGRDNKCTDIVVTEEYVKDKMKGYDAMWKEHETSVKETEKSSKKKKIVVEEEEKPKKKKKKS